MKNKAKCKLCGDVIMSYHQYDYVECKCGEITVDGGEAMRCAAKNWDNFLRVDDEGKEHPIKIEELSKFDLADMEPYPNDKPKLSKEDLIMTIVEMRKNIENLPMSALQSPLTHYDMLSLLMLLESLFKLP
jgi:hypothetical protein